ncbi:hypothetical protein CRENBAI_010769 [Crenichthys baileyi]|uniref:Ig-like domain-containing protein n=1 Tax=Crenichthys baileyi TaxID=28760 RepID=A0AAV9SL57_9TELE
MTEPLRGLIYLPIIYLWTGVEGNVLASLAPPVHLSGERLGLTLLVCVVSDFRRGHLEISWRSASDEDYTNIAPYNGAVTRRHHGHSPVAMITVVTSEWPSYSCSVRRRKHSKATKKHRITSTGEDKMCNNDEEREGIDQVLPGFLELTFSNLSGTLLELTNKNTILKI